MEISTQRNRLTLRVLAVAVAALNGGAVSAASATVVLSKVAAVADASPLGGTFSALSDPVFTTSRQLVFEGTSTGIFQKSGSGLVTIAASGDTSPVGGTFVTFGLPAVNASGLTVFWARVHGGSTTQAIFGFSGGVITPLVRAGDPAPGGSSFSSLRHHPSVNAAGDIAFGAVVDGADGVFVRSASGTVSKIALEDESTPCGGRYRSFGASTLGPSLNDSGEVAFQANVGGGPDGVFRFSAGVVSAVACEGGPSPLGGTFRSFGRRPSLNNLGDVVFQAVTDTGPSNLDGVFVASASICSPLTLCSLAAEGDAAPRGGTFTAFSANIIPAINDAPTVAFQGRVSDANTGLFLFSGGSLSAVVLRGDVCPVGGTFQSPDREVTLNASGTLAFRSGCTGGRGIFRFPSGGPASAVALTTDSTALGVGFDFSNPAVDGAGVVAFDGSRTALFSATCTGSGCGGVSSVVAPTDLVPAFPGESIAILASDSIAGAAGSVVLIATTFGANSREGIFLLRRGVLSKIAAGGDSAPSTGAEFFNFTFPPLLVGDESLVKPALRGRDVGFIAGLDTGTGIFVSRRGRLAKVAQEGDAAPGGGIFSTFTVPSIGGSRVVFAADTGVATCIFQARSGSIAPQACVGDLVPAPVGGMISNFLSAPILSGTSTFFRASVSGGTSADCIFRKQGSSLTTMACDGDVAPVGGSFVSFENFAATTWLASRRRGVAAFAQTANEGIFLFKNGTTTTIVADGDPLPAPLVGVFTGFQSTDLFSFKGNKIAFSSNEGVFLAQLQ